jgi:hypothetical protein
MIFMTFSQARMICSAEMIDSFGFLPVGGTGKFTGGPQSGLQGQITTIINGDWGHFKVDTPINTLILRVYDVLARHRILPDGVACSTHRDGRCGSG